MRCIELEQNMKGARSVPEVGKSQRSAKGVSRYFSIGICKVQKAPLARRKRYLDLIIRIKFIFVKKDLNALRLEVKVECPGLQYGKKKYPTSAAHGGKAEGTPGPDIIILKYFYFLIKKACALHKALKLICGAHQSDGR